MCKHKVLIIQNSIHEYRKPLYNKLSDSYDITILHSGKKTYVQTDRYKEIITNKFVFRTIVFQGYVLTEAKSDNYDVIIAMFDLHWIKNILLSMLPIDKPIIFWGHRYSESKNTNKVKNYFLKKCSAILLYNGSEISSLVNNGIRGEKIFIAENTIHVENHENLSSSAKSSFLYVGRAQKRKKVDELLFAFYRIIDRIPEHITVDIVGDGEEIKHLESLAKTLNIHHRVFFYGAISDHDILKLFFKKAIAYVSPDAIGLGAQHSFAYGVPVLTTSSGFKGAEYDNLEHNINALLFKRFEDLDLILIQLINSPELVRRLGNNSYQKYIKSLRIEFMIKGFQDAITYSLNER